MRLLAQVLGLLGIAISAARVSAESCPESCVLTYCSTAAQRETTVAGSTLFGSPGAGFGSYDLVSGLAAARFSAATEGGAPAGSAKAVDRFTLVGPPSSSPVTFTARFFVSGYANPRSYSGGTFQEDNNPPLKTTPIYDYPYSYTYETLILTLVRSVGEPFLLTYALSANGSGSGAGAQANGTLTFADLPPGYGVTSCQGYAAGVVVPTQAVSWGRLKSLYR